MGRRRHGLFGNITYRIAETTRAAWWWLRAVVLYPFQLAAEVWYSLTGLLFAGSTRRSFGGALLDQVLLVPRLTGQLITSGIATAFHTALSWPRAMRWRDLLAGLPALAAAVTAVLVLFVFHKSDQEVFDQYDLALKSEKEALQTETDEKAQKASLNRMLLYYRALSKFNEADPAYRFAIAIVHFSLGEVNRGEAIMNDLAPRDTPGYPPAHIWQAERLIPRMPSEQAFNDAREHLKMALESNDKSRENEINYKLGRLYFDAYVQYRPQPLDFQHMPRPNRLEQAAEHLSKVKGGDREVALLLGKIHALRGDFEKARLSIELLVKSYETTLKNDPGDVEARLLLAVAYRDVNDFDRALAVLNEGRNRKPDPRFDLETSTTYFFAALAVQQLDPTAFQKQYAALRLGYLNYPTNGFVIARVLQGLTGTPVEAPFARAMLQEVLTVKDRAAMAHFLLGFDAAKQAVWADSRRHYDEARKSKDESIPYTVADVVLANLQLRSKAIDTTTALQVNDAGLQIWPQNPGLLMVRGWAELQSKNYAAALGYLNKALEHRQNDAKLHSMLNQAYRGLGQTVNAENHRLLAESAQARAKAMEVRQSTGGKSAP